MADEIRPRRPAGGHLPAQQPALVRGRHEIDLLSIVIPARNEAACLEATVRVLWQKLEQEGITHELVVVNDHSTDNTGTVLRRLSAEIPTLVWFENADPPGFGYAIRAGLDKFRGDAVCIVMADASDDPDDVVAYYRKLAEGYECVFGSRFTRKSRVIGYPPFKRVVNRAVNWGIRVLFGLKYNDVTNAFKCYRREVIEGIRPLLACHFNLTVELPLKAIVRGYSYATIPINWSNRKSGVSNLKLKEMGSRYLFIVLYVFIERLLSRGDYHRRDHALDRA